MDHTAPRHEKKVTKKRVTKKGVTEKRSRQNGQDRTARQKVTANRGRPQGQICRQEVRGQWHDISGGGRSDVIHSAELSGKNAPSF
jgi:hypothetical protein